MKPPDRPPERLHGRVYEIVKARFGGIKKFAMRVFMLVFKTQCVYHGLKGERKRPLAKPPRRKTMRAPKMTPERQEREDHYAAVKAIVGDLNLINGLKREDQEVYNHFTGTPEAVAARILTAREVRKVSK